MTEVEKIPFSDGNQIPAIGLGTSPLNEEEADKLLESALGVGYSHIDTAFLYDNEASLGKALSKRLKAGQIKREDLFITSKLPPNGMRRDLVKRFLQLSLKRLQVDYVDLYLVHICTGIQYKEDDDTMSKDENGEVLWDKNTDILEIWKGMEEVKDLGLAKSIGLSNFNSFQIQRILENCKFEPANLQVECHLYFQQKELVDFCQQKGIAVTAYTPLGNPNLGELKKKQGLSTSELPVPLKDPVLAKIAQKYNRTPAQISLRWLIQRKIVVIPRSSNPSRMKENLQVFDFHLETTDTEELDALDRKFRFFEMDDYYQGIKEHPEYPFSVPF